MVKEILLGDNPFIGVSHLAQEKAREARRRIEEFTEVVKTSQRAGATGFTFTAHPVNQDILERISKEEPGLLGELNYYILVPYGMGYVRRSTAKGLPRLGLEILGKSLSRMDRLKWLLRAVLGLDPAVFLAMQLERDILPFLRLLPRSRLKAVLLHEVLSEVIVAHRAPRAYRVIKTYMEDNYGLPVGLESRNICALRDFLRANNITAPYIMTPMNPLGYQMTPSKRRAEECIEELGRESKIIVVNILASGAIGLEDAVKYLEKWKNLLYGVAVGTSKPWRAEQNFSFLKKVFLQ